MSRLSPIENPSVSSPFGQRWGGMHYGTDYAAPEGTPIYAPVDGVVVEGKDRPQGSVTGFGSWIWIDGGDVDLIFGHVRHEGIRVKKGDRVKVGDVIGEVGNEGQSTGPHLHFEVWETSRLSGRAIDPEKWLESSKSHLLRRIILAIARIQELL